MLNAFQVSINCFTTRFVHKIRDRDGKYCLHYNDPFLPEVKEAMWAFICGYWKMHTWLISCGLSLRGRGIHKQLIVQEGASLNFSTYPSALKNEWTLQWDLTAACIKRNIEAIPADDNQFTSPPNKRSRRSGGLCSQTPFDKMHPRNQAKITAKFSKAATQVIENGVVDKSTSNVNSIALSVSKKLTKELITHCADKGILENARKLLENMYGSEESNSEVKMYLKGLAIMENHIANRMGDLEAMANMRNLKKSLVIATDSHKKHQDAALKLTKVLTANKIEKLLLLDVSDGVVLSEKLRARLILQAICTINICGQLAFKYEEKCSHIIKLMDKLKHIAEDEILSIQDKTFRIQLNLTTYGNKDMMMSWKVDNCTPLIIRKVKGICCEDDVDRKSVV